jgi:SAM-dependent methyltransferase
MPEPALSPDQQLAQLKQRLKSSWMAGDFGQIAKKVSGDAESFVSRLQLQPGTKVLDVACGTGNQSLTAARAGALVTGVDIATNLLAQARQRAAEENLKIQLDEGDAEELPYADEQFDVVLSMFGAMFAPRPEVVARELQRVCRPGGLIAMANWTPDGFVGKSFQVSGKQLPPPPGIPAPVLWGREDVVRERFGPGVTLQMQKRIFILDLPMTPTDSVDFYRQYFGPTLVAFSRLDAEGQKRMRDELIALWTEFNVAEDDRTKESTSPHTKIPAEYLEVYARRR